MKRERSLAKNTVILSIGTFLPKLTAFITLPILTAYLTQAEYGTYDLISTLISLVLPIATLKLEAGVFRFLIDVRSDQNEASKVISTAAFFIVPVSFLAAFAMFFFLKFQMTTRILVCVYFFVDSLYNAIKQVARGMSKNHIYSITSVVNSLLNAALIVIMVKYAGKGLDGLVISSLIAIVIAAIFLIQKIGLVHYISIKHISKDLFKKMVAYSWPMLPNSLSSWVMRLSDRLVILAVLGVEANAVYAVANKIPQLLTFAQNPFVIAWQENASVAVEDRDAGEYYSHMFDAVFTLLIGLMCGLITCMPVLFKLLIKGDYSEAYFQMPLLLGGMLFFALSSFLGGIYVAHMKTKSVGITTMIAAVSNLIINIALIRRIGLYAASFSTLSSYVILCTYRMYDIQKFQQIHFRGKRIAAYLFVVTCMSVACWLDIFWLNIVNFVAGISFALIINRSIVKKVWKSVMLSSFKR